MEGLFQDTERKSSLSAAVLKAVIFDMDGVLVDSEPFWSQAEREVFGSLGVSITNELCEQTKKMTTTEVSEFWYERFPWSQDVSIDQSERMVIDKVKSLIESTDCIIPGVSDFIRLLKASGLKLGIATNAPFEIIPVVMNKAGVEDCIDALCSSQHEAQCKPAPDVYLSALEKLGVSPPDTLAIEDSDAGIQAARKAGLKVAAFTQGGMKSITEQADLYISDFRDIDVPRFILN